MIDKNITTLVKTMRSGFTGLSLMCLASICVATQPTLSDGHRSMLREAIKTAQAAEQLVGVQAAVFYGGKIAFSFSRGYADLEHEVSVSASTRFEVASVTKAFTGLGLLLLDEQGGIDLDAPVQKYVPDFPEKQQGTLTPRMLAGALGGIRHYSSSERTPEFYATHYDNVADAIDIFKDDPLVARPGERVVYSSYGYNLLAAVMQNATGKRFQDYITDTIIDPLGLTNTGQIDVRLPMANRARMYSFIDPYSREVSDRLMVIPTMEHSYNAGGGNLYSTAEDLATFGSKFIAPGFLSEQIHEQIYTPHQTASGEPTWFSDGWVLIGLTENPPSLISGGSYPGVQAMLRVYPDEAMVIVLLTNTWGKKGSGGAFTNELSNELAKIVLSAAE